MQHFGKKVIYKGNSFDSVKERDFFIHFIENCSKHYEVHPRYQVLGKFPVGGYNMRGVSYTPDFVVYNGTDILHVYDVKTSLSPRAIDSAAKIRFTLFARKYGIPVEVVVPRKNNFKMKIYGLPSIQTAHEKHDRHGNVKTTAKGNPTYDHYDVFSSIDYNIHDIIGK